MKNNNRFELEISTLQDILNNLNTDFKKQYAVMHKELGG